MPAVGGFLSRAALGGALLLALGVSAGCVQQAVLENDVRNAQWKARTLTTAADLRLAEAALAAQLVELEALYQRAPSDARVSSLLDRGYGLMARGFIELRRLEALAAGDDATATREAALAGDAEARARFYRQGSPAGADARLPLLSDALAAPEKACLQHDRAGYERELNQLLARSEKAPEERLELALSRSLASLWLMPKVAARCGF